MSMYNLITHIALGALFFAVVINIVTRFRAPRDIPTVRSALPFGNMRSAWAFFSRRTDWLLECRYGHVISMTMHHNDIDGLQEVLR